jgi:hypothetical protein
MSKKGQDEQMAEAFFQDVVAIVDKYADKMEFEDTIGLLQSIVVTMACNTDLSEDEAAEFLHGIVDDCLDSMAEDDSEAIEIED